MGYWYTVLIHCSVLIHWAGIPFFFVSSLSLICLISSVLWLSCSCFLQRPLILVFPVSQCPPPQTNLKLHSIKGQMSLFSHPKEAGQCTAVLGKIKESRGALESAVGEVPTEKLLFPVMLDITVSSSPLVKAAISSLFLRLKPPQGLGRWLSMAPHHPWQQRSLLSPCLALALLSYTAAAENLVLQLPLEHLLLVEAQESTEATW